MNYKFTPYPLDNAESLEKYAETLKQDKRDSLVAVFDLNDDIDTDLEDEELTA